MPSRRRRNFSLTPQLIRFIDERIAAGHYQTTSDVVCEALQLLEKRERELDEAYDALKKKLRRAAAQAKSGRFISSEEAFTDLMSVFSDKKKARSK